jgi:hypothetical protein
MAEAKFKKTATKKFIEKFPHCALCGGQRAATTREHCPPKSLFLKSHRPDGFIAPACQDCQDISRTADLLTSIISRFTYSDFEEYGTDLKRLKAILNIKAPEAAAELNPRGLIERKSARRFMESQGAFAPNNNLVTIGPECIRLINIFSAKFILATFFIFSNKILDKNSAISYKWYTKEQIQTEPIPDEVKSMLGNSSTLTQGKWDTKLHFECRHSYNEVEGCFGVMARFNGAFFVLGYAVQDREKLGTSPGWSSAENALEEASKNKSRNKMS